MVLNCVIIDDEPLARECIGNYIRQVGFMEAVGFCNNPLKLSKIQEGREVDLIFLDVQMPRMNGIEFLKVATKVPMVVLTTAYPNYAVDGFELDVLDYLLKPVTFDRFFKAACKARDYRGLTDAGTGNVAHKEIVPDDFIFVKSDGCLHKIRLGDILFVEAMQNYVTFNTCDGKKHIALMPLKYVEEQLGSDMFVKVHKSFIVAFSRIDSVEGGRLAINGHKVPVSRSYRSNLFARIDKKKI